MIRSLEKLIKVYGWAYIAYRLGLRDTWAVKKWVERKVIPEEHKSRVRKLIKRHKTIGVFEYEV